MTSRNATDKATTARRITLNLREREAAELEERASRHQMKLNEVVRRAISRDQFIEEKLESGARILVEEQDGTTHLVEFVG